MATELPRTVLRSINKGRDNPGGFAPLVPFGAVLLAETRPARFPKPIMNPSATALFTSPAKFPPIHASPVAMLGKRPAAMTMLPAYWTAGVFVAMSMAYPTIATVDPAKMNGPRIRFLSER